MGEAKEVDSDNEAEAFAKAMGFEPYRDPTSEELDAQMRRELLLYDLRPRINLIGRASFRCRLLAMRGVLAGELDCEPDEIDIREGDVESDDPSVSGDQIYLGGKLVGFIDHPGVETKATSINLAAE